MNRLYYIVASLMVVVLLLVTYALQAYQLTSLEEVHIMLYDRDYIGSVLRSPGGFAQVLASLCTQFFLIRWLGPLLVAVVYGVIVFSLVSVAVRLRSRLFVVPTAVLPCLCLMLCLENYSYEFQGTMALMLCSVALAAYSNLRRLRIVEGCLVSAILYYAAGSAALSFAVAAMLFDLLMRRPMAWLTVLYPVICVAVGYGCYLAGLLATPEQFYTPAMYYEMGSTYFMMIYAMCSLPIVVSVLAIFRSDGRPNGVTYAVTLTVFALCLGCAYYFYGLVHSASNYQNNRERYLARNGQWQAIIDMPYDGSPTPYTSYRFLALAKQGLLAERVGQYRPFISYIFENKPKVKKRDQQIYSDIYFACDYMAAARHSAFDTDIVTPGAFNPYETQKLVDINIAFGDYAVAEKLIAKLEKTLFYSAWAKDRRRLLYDDRAVEADAELGPKRRAIPPVNDYMSPKGIGRDLKHIADVNPDQQTAREFYAAYMKTLER